MPDSPPLLPPQVLLVSPQTHVLEQPPELPIQPVPLFIICWMRSTGTGQKVWRKSDHTRPTEAVWTAVLQSPYDRDEGRVSVAPWMTWRESDISLNINDYRMFIFLLIGGIAGSSGTASGTASHLSFTVCLSPASRSSFTTLFILLTTTCGGVSLCNG